MRAVAEEELMVSLKVMAPVPAVIVTSVPSWTGSFAVKPPLPTVSVAPFNPIVPDVAVKISPPLESLIELALIVRLFPAVSVKVEEADQAIESVTVIFPAPEPPEVVITLTLPLPKLVSSSLVLILAVSVDGV